MHCEHMDRGKWDRLPGEPSRPDPSRPAPQPSARPYHPSSFAFATVAVAEDLERIAETLRNQACVTSMSTHADSALGQAAERLDHQASALREIARKACHSGLAEAFGRAGIEPLGLTGSADPDAEGPSFDDPPDEPKRR